MFTPIPYLNYYYKYIGSVIGIIGIGLMIFSTEYSKFSEWIIILGFFIIAYSKDKSKDQELRKRYRYNSLRISFALLFLIILITTFRNIIADYSNEINILHFGIAYLVLYLIIYYIQVILRLKNFATDNDISENYKGNKAIYLFVLIILVLIIAVSLIF